MSSATLSICSGSRSSGAIFRKVNKHDDSLADLFTEDVDIFFPKFGTARGKAALARFGERIGRQLRSLEHEIDGLVFAGDRIAVEGKEQGATNDGLS
ncbi:nuclear transport factor 2 family protein [Corticibacterium sp. UT-5YL-CI-8]|nr:nuclear transport factor 2 family protein [Tianweitania sp. UT-5YL-CI-8]